MFLTLPALEIATRAGEHSRLTMLVGLCALGAGIALLSWVAWLFTQADTRVEMAERPRFEHAISLGYLAHGRGDVGGTMVTAETVAETGEQPPMYAPELSKIDLVFNYEMRTAQEISVTGYGGVALRITGQDGWERTIAILPAQPLPESPQQTLRATLDLDVVRLVIDGVEFATGSRSDSYDLTIVPVVRLFGDLGGSHIDETYAPEYRWRYSLARVTPDVSLTKQETHYERVAVSHNVDAPGLPVQLAMAQWLTAALGGLALVASFALLWRQSPREQREPPDAHSMRLREAAEYVPESAETAAGLPTDVAIPES